jgi:CDP-6-deoxy-D-xylo-4-hexulose-3-dehydrase
MDRIETFTTLRRRNWEYLREGLKDLEDYLLLPQPTPESEPSWFGFAITLRKNSPATRDKIVIALNEKKIATRLLFGGNLTRQPAFLDTPMRIVGNLNNSDFVMNNTFWIGVWPGLTEKMLDYVIDTMHHVVKGT